MVNLNSGDLLIAPPKMPDLRFRKTVLMMTHEHEVGTIALCVNRPSTHTLQDIAKDLDLEVNINFPLYWGGPVSHGTIWMLHTAEWQCEGTIDISDDWSMTSNEAMFHHLADGDCPREFRMMFGYCSWAPGQLEAEMRGIPPWTHQSSWLVAQNPGPEWLLEQPVELLWERSTELCGKQAVASWL
jgi:putative transcriptional regulator